MKIFLAAELHAHRRGRFLTTLLDAELPSDGRLPDTGYLMMIGEHFQQSEQAREYFSWIKSPGRVLLLLPPYREGVITDALNWRIGYTQNAPVSLHQDSLSAMVQSEVIYRIDGNDGDSDRLCDHGWADRTSHTRYWKVHANGGIMAATLLPLWSISLINSGAQVKQWLSWFMEQSGKVRSPDADARLDEDTMALMPNDYTIMVCCYGWDVSAEVELTGIIDRSAVPIISLSDFDLPDNFGRLRRCGLLNDTGLTPRGLEILKSSPYWSYAGQLREMGMS